MEIRKNKVSSKRVGFVYTGTGAAARDHAEIFKDGKKVGVVTSGSHGPTVGKNLGMAYIDNPHNEAGTKL
jgi:aminomethyltransferase